MNPTCAKQLFRRSANRWRQIDLVKDDVAMLAELAVADAHRIVRLVGTKLLAKLRNMSSSD